MMTGDDRIADDGQERKPSIGHQICTGHCVGSRRPADLQLLLSS